MATYTELCFPSFTPDDAGEYYRRWLTESGRSHDDAAIRAFAGAHRVMFGRQTASLERGYRSWLRQGALDDTAESFGSYIAPRYRRWQSSVRATDPAVALGNAAGRRDSLAA